MPIIRNMSKYNNLEIQELADAFKALANPNRLQIFLQLLNCCEPATSSKSSCVPEFCVGDLGEHISVAPSTLSHHVKELQRAGLIKTQRQGQHVSCQIEPETINALKKFLNGEIK